MKSWVSCVVSVVLPLVLVVLICPDASQDNTNQHHRGSNDRKEDSVAERNRSIWSGEASRSYSLVSAHRQAPLVNSFYTIVA